MAGNWNGTSYYIINVENGDYIVASSSISGSSGVNSLSAFGLFVS